VLKKLEDCLAKIETSEGFKKMLGLQPSQYLASLNERQTADLIYRDNARIKHSQSKRLELEISDKSELVPAPVSIVQPAHDLSPLSKALIDHLRRASATPVNGKKILFGGKKSWLGDMLSMLQSSFAQPPPSRKQLGAPAPDDPDGSRELGIQEFLTSVQDEPSVSPMDIGVSSVVPFERRITNRPDELGGGSAFSFMAGACASNFPSVVQAGSATDSASLLLDSEFIFFTVVSENMNSYKLLGTQMESYDVMVQPYIPTAGSEVDDHATDITL
ncbi:unnamed protein product, partial [Durusdinium trenchii]